MRRVIVFGALLLVGLAFAQSFGMMDRDHLVRDAWTWEGEASTDGFIRLRNRSGSVTVEESEGPGIEIVASKSWTGRRPQQVDFVANREGSDVYVCALYGGGDEEDCAADTYRSRSIGWFKRKVLNVRPVTTRFTVRAPAHARVDVETSDGQISVRAPLAALVANTRNGSIKTAAAVGSIEAHTRNGSISAILADGPLAGDVILESRNGSVTAELPDSANARVELITRNGRVTTDFPLTVSGISSTRSISGTLGTGGPQVKLETRNGSVKLKRRAASDATTVGVTVGEGAGTGVGTSEVKP